MHSLIARRKELRVSVVRQKSLWKSTMNLDFPKNITLGVFPLLEMEYFLKKRQIGEICFYLGSPGATSPSFPMSCSMRSVWRKKTPPSLSRGRKRLWPRFSNRKVSEEEEEEAEAEAIKRARRRT